MVLLISYDLNGHERPEAYQAVKKAIEGYAIDTRKPLYSQWLVQTNESCKAWSDRVQAAADKGDKILVVRLFEGHYQGWLAKDIWPWLRDRL